MLFTIPLELPYFPTRAFQYDQGTAATLQVAKSLSQVQPRITQTSAGKHLWAEPRRRMCVKKQLRLWLCVSWGAAMPREAGPCSLQRGYTCPLCWWDASSRLQNRAPWAAAWGAEGLRWLPLPADVPVLRTASAWSVIRTSRGCVPQRGASSLLYLPRCPQHQSPAGAVGGGPAQGLGGHMCELDWQEWDCSSWEPRLFPPTATRASKDPAKCTVTKNGLLTRTNLKETLPVY